MPTDPRPAARELAERIARDVFTNGQGDRAERLVLIADGRDLGGWSERAMAGRIEAALCPTKGDVDAD